MDEDKTFDALKKLPFKQVAETYVGPTSHRILTLLRKDHLPNDNNSFNVHIRDCGWTIGEYLEYSRRK